MNSEQVGVVMKKVWDWGHVHTFLAGAATGVASTFGFLLWARMLYWMSH